jgi:hypothetical protein
MLAPGIDTGETKMASTAAGYLQILAKMTLAAAALGAAQAAHAASWVAVQDTFVYEFLGNQGAPDGDSGGILAWNHEAAHGGKGLVQFDPGWMLDPALGGDFTATLHLYQFCEPSAFIAACPGDPGAPEVKTDVILQDVEWLETTATWDDINEDTTPPVATITQTSSAPGWIEIDVTALVVQWLAGAGDFGFALSQEAYPVLRADNGGIPVAAFCDSESSGGICATGDFRPYLSIAPAAVPVPGAAWLLGPALAALLGFRRRA